MTPKDFTIGTEFECGGLRWRCTDIGTRTILAIALDRNGDPSWYNGPPYAVHEHVFDENNLEAITFVFKRPVSQMTDIDWITITLADTGLRKRIRPRLVTAYWTARDAAGLRTFIEINNNAIEITETDTELAHLLGDDILAKAGA